MQRIEKYIFRCQNLRTRKLTANWFFYLCIRLLITNRDMKMRQSAWYMLRCVCFFYFPMSYLPLATSQPVLVPEKQLVMTGVYYYPEHWPRTQWERDLKKMAELGFEFTHFGEFAWAMMEPEEGRYEFGWLDEVVALAAKYGLKVIMCTPTPTPPAWLTEKHPEILIVDDNGIQQAHGSRLHVSYHHPVYQHYIRKIVTELGRRYGQDPRIWGWQLDNEPHYGTLYDYSEANEKSFRHWLRQKYGTIERLNTAWGAAFWSQQYNHFDQVHIPNRKKAPQGANPHALADFQRFTADELAAALRFQAQLLRPLISPQQWITTNYAYFKFLPNVDPFRNRADLDFASHTMYLTSHYLNDSGDSLAHRLGSGMELSFSAELARSVNGQTGIMELQPGQINWGTINPQPLPGAVGMWMWHAFALGDRFICSYRFRQPLFGSEQTHNGIMSTDGVTVARGGEEYVETMKVFRRLRERYKTPPQVPQSYRSRATALLWKPENILDIENHRHHQDYDPWQLVYTYYENLKTLGAPVTFLTEADAFDPASHPFMVAPAYQLTSTDLVEKWKKYVEAGGHLILTHRTAMKNPEGHLWEGPLQQPINSLIGAKVEFFDHLPASRPGKVRFNGTDYAWHKWADVLLPEAGTEVLATHTDQFYQGKPTATRRKLGKGTVTYIGAWSNSRELERLLLRQVYQQAGAEVLDLPRYVFTEWRDGYWVTVNYTAQTVQAPVPPGAEILHGQPTLPPAGVVVWK